MLKWLDKDFAVATITMPQEVMANTFEILISEPIGWEIEKIKKPNGTNWKFYNWKVQWLKLKKKMTGWTAEQNGDEGEKSQWTWI